MRTLLFILSSYLTIDHCVCWWQIGKCELTHTEAKRERTCTPTTRISRIFGWEREQIRLAKQTSERTSPHFAKSHHTRTTTPHSGVFLHRIVGITSNGKKSVCVSVVSSCAHVRQTASIHNMMVISMVVCFLRMSAA